VDVNLRGRDLVSWVAEAQAAVQKAVSLPNGYSVKWGGQFENFERAQARLELVGPVVIAIILGMLLLMFQNLRFTLAVFSLVPLSLAGGMMGLLMRGLSFSLPAAVGFIALGGIAVLNGVVIASEVRQRLQAGERLDDAISAGSSHVIRAVLTTAFVASLGFLPMALATGAGAEVQRPLATVVVIGMLVSTLETLIVFPAILRVSLRGYKPAEEKALDDQFASRPPPPPGAFTPAAAEP
jgi:cobalt-zinc-cadmium resistance protein CzcA